MKLYRFFVCVVLTTLSVVMSGCTNDNGVDNRETDYGYVQFKLYKEASYTPQARSITTQLDWLSQAYKVRVMLSYNVDAETQQTITVTLPLNSANSEAAEWGLRSDKVKLLAGEYKVITYTLYDAYDGELYLGTPAATDNSFVVEVGGLTTRDLTVNVVARGQVRFSFVKDMSEIPDSSQTVATRAAEREYTFDEIDYANITVRNLATNRETTFEELEMKFYLDFVEENGATISHRTSYLECDSVMWLEAGEYRIVRYECFDDNDFVIDRNSPEASNATFSVSDNKLTDVEVPVLIYGEYEYIKDYRALYEIWKSLDGPNWYYVGEDYNRGANWNFDKDVDLWGDQPGVQLHANGRVARIDISDFAFKGDLSPAIGQLSELIELYLGTHNDRNLITYDPSLSMDLDLTERGRRRIENHKKYLSIIHPATQMSEPCARALMEHNIEAPSMMLYKTMSESEIIDTKSGVQRTIRPMDTNYGTLCNGLTSLPKEIGKLKNMQYLMIANSTIAELPEELGDCHALTDIEIYNCPNMTKFPMAMAKLPALISINISNNKQWSAEELYKGLDAIAQGPAKKQIQLLYSRENSLEEVPASFSNMHSLSLLDMSYNKIRTIHPLGKNVGLVQLYLDHNELEELPRDAEGYFCAYDDVETFSVTYNKLKKVPNIFSAKSKFTMTTVDFSANEIDGFEDEEKTGDEGYNGLKVETLTLTQNKFSSYPTAIAKSNSYVAYIILRANNMTELPDEAFEYKNSANLVSFDLSYNKLTSLPDKFHAGNMPYLYGVDLSFNSFSKFPFEPLDARSLTVFAVRSQRNDKGERCLKEWPTGLYNHTGLRGFYIGSNDLRKIDDTISTLIYYLDISDNPRIIFDASDICSAWMVGAYYLLYDKTQDIRNCDYMLE
ncbi:MAG: DUF4458 domain-containing protein [Rikenellaceae bacterium]|nr:DUF4458 domain-containing protein [Rikenellaceae bacterium]